MIYSSVSYTSNLSRMKPQDSLFLEIDRIRFCSVEKELVVYSMSTSSRVKHNWCARLSNFLVPSLSIQCYQTELALIPTSLYIYIYPPEHLPRSLPSFPKLKILVSYLRLYIYIYMHMCIHRYIYTDIYK